MAAMFMFDPGEHFSYRPPGHTISAALDAQWPFHMHTTSSLLHQTCASDISPLTVV
jgi:hypothetical protein